MTIHPDLAPPRTFASPTGLTRLGTVSARPTRSRRAATRPTVHHDVVTAAVDLLIAAAAAKVLLDPAPSSLPPALVALAVAATWVALLSGARCYAPGPLRGGSGGLRRVIRAGTALVTLLALGPAVAPGLVPYQSEPVRLLALSAAVCAGAIVQRTRPTVAQSHRRTSRGRLTNAVIAGHGRDVSRVMAELAADGRQGLGITAVCVPATSRTPFDVPVVRGFDLLATAAVAQGAEVVIVLPCHHFDPTTLRRIGWRLESEGIDLVVASGLLDVDRSRAHSVRAGGLHLVHVRHAELTGARRVLKQLWERPAAAVTLVLLSPLLAVIALAIRLDSPGPALFRQVRIGKDSKPFVMVKLRTMTLDAEDRLAGLTSDGRSDDVLFKMRVDPRVTPLGRLLRRYSIDELPQLINVVRGEMSLVGPRPPLGSEVLEYDGDTLRRLAVRPGITGLWQVSGRSDLAWNETVRLDLRYVENWSLTLDAIIIARTLRAVVGHRGAY